MKYGEDGKRIIDAIALLRAAFAALGSDGRVPTAIHLADPVAGMELEGALLQLDHCLVMYSDQRYRVIAFDGQLWRELEILGVRVRWPASVAALEGGGIRIS